MSFLNDLTKKASGIVSKGKNFLTDQLSTETVYERDASGNMQMVSDTGNKPKIMKTAKEFLIPGRGYTDAQIAAAKPTKKETVVGVAKAAGEIVQGGLTLTHMLGNKIADTVLPGYDAEASAAYRNTLNEKVSTKLAPKTAGEAKVMRGADILGLAPVGSVGKVTRIDDLIKASNKADAFRTLKTQGFTDDVIRANNLDTKIAAATDEVAVNKVLSEIKAPSTPPVRTANMDIKPPVTPVTPAKPTKQFDIPKKPTGEVDVDTYIKQQTVARESARGNKSLKTKTSEFLQNLENKMIDFTSPIQRRVNAAKSLTHLQCQLKMTSLITLTVCLTHHQLLMPSSKKKVLLRRYNLLTK